MQPFEDRRAQLVDELLHELSRALSGRSPRPRSTYRVQLNRDFPFKDAAAIVPYLSRLGISHLYTSPCLKASPGSLHGYDVVDHRSLNPELGAAFDHQELVSRLLDHGMGHLIDFVPNHMAIGSDNPCWMDVLENGPSSVFAPTFDIDWDPIKEELKNRVLLPVLGDQYGAVLERGELRLSFDVGALQLHYFDQRFPITPRQYGRVLAHRLPELTRTLGEGNVHLQDLLSILTHLEKLPPRTEKDPARLVERNREKEVIKRRLIALCEASPPIAELIETNVRIFNGTPGDPRSFDLLDGLLREQAYRLAYWRVAAEEINFRRFFDINALAAIRMEDPHVMQEAHALVLDLIAEGKVFGLRIDHPDGLYCPETYFARLQEEYVVSSLRRLLEARAGPDGASSAFEQWRDMEPLVRERYRREAGKGRESPLHKPLFVVAEKILEDEETMPSAWAVHGTTGYDFLNRANGLFVDARNARPMEEIATRFVGETVVWRELVHEKKRQVMADSLVSEINVLSRQLNRLSELDRRTRDFTLGSLKRALVEVVAHFPVYRTYLTGEEAAAEEHDVRSVESAVRRAKRRSPLNPSIFDFIGDVLLLRSDPAMSPDAKLARRSFTLKLQQLTASVMAKGVEDTAFYLYNRLVSLNEVGGNPEVFGGSVSSFHRLNAERLSAWPGSLNATTTHDTKRSEDVRARIDVLSEVPTEWRRRLRRWARLNRRHKTVVQERPAPDRNEELLLYQTLLGTWPFGPHSAEAATAYRDRISAYLHKAIREGKVNSSWINPDESWHRAATAFVAAILDPRRSKRFIEDFASFQRGVARAGAFNSLSQLVLKMASPGVPDFYQGNELWDFSLVDPDNRRPVDFAYREGLLESLAKRVEQGRRALADELVATFEDGRIKLYTTWQGLLLRRRFPRLFEEGDYVPLAAEGERAHHAVAFARRDGADSVFVIVPRLVAGLLERDPRLCGVETWGDTFLSVPYDPPATAYIDVFTGDRHEVRSVGGRAGFSLTELFTGFPVVILATPGRAEPEDAAREEEGGRAPRIERAEAAQLGT